MFSPSPLLHMVSDSGSGYDLSFLTRRSRVRIRASAFDGVDITFSALEDSVCPAMPDTLVPQTGKSETDGEGFVTG